MYKMYCIFAKESIDKMKGSRGKLASQAGHAYLHAFWDAQQLDMRDDLVDGLNITRRKAQQAVAYQQSKHAYKITLVVDTVEELVQLQDKYKTICGTSLVKDAGFTVFEEPTITCLGLGPIFVDNIGDDLKSLKLLT
jgi:peptidyl-tRNA hydrolase